MNQNFLITARGKGEPQLQAPTALRPVKGLPSPTVQTVTCPVKSVCPCHKSNPNFDAGQAHDFLAVPYRLSVGDLIERLAEEHHESSQGSQTSVEQMTLGCRNMKFHFIPYFVYIYIYIYILCVCVCVCVCACAPILTETKSKPYLWEKEVLQSCTNQDDAGRRDGRRKQHA